MIERLRNIRRNIKYEIEQAGIIFAGKSLFQKISTVLFSKEGRQLFPHFSCKIFRIITDLFNRNMGLAPLYSQWLSNYNSSKPSDEYLLEQINCWNKRVLISVIMPVYNPDPDHLRSAVDSVKAQIYTNWELCISDDCSSEEVRNLVQELSFGNDKIKLNLGNTTGHISMNMNEAATMAEGDYVTFLDQDDLLAPDALYHVARVCNEKDPDILYSDEDKINDSGNRFDPFFKPQWSPHTILSRNYINHLLTIKKDIFIELGGFRRGYEGSQDHDLLLRAMNITNEIEHIPEILYHWRVHENSTSLNPESKSWAYLSGLKAVRDSVSNNGFDSDISLYDNTPGNYNVSIKVAGSYKVSIIIVISDESPYSDKCLKSLFEVTEYSNFEVLLIDSSQKGIQHEVILSTFNHLYPGRLFYEKYNGDINKCAAQNFGALKSKGDYLLFLDGKSELLTPDWIEKLLGFSQLNNAGAVGAKIYYPNRRLKHVGVVLGIGGVSGNVYSGNCRNNSGYYHSNKLVTNYSAVSGACMMVSRDKFEELNGFNENFVVEYGDIDFCLRLYAKGYYNIYNPLVELVQTDPNSTRKTKGNNRCKEQGVKDAELFSSEWAEQIKDDPFYNIRLGKENYEFNFEVK